MFDKLKWTILPIFLVFFSLGSLEAKVYSVDYIIEFNAERCNYDAKIVIVEGNAFSLIDRVQFNAQYTIVVPQGTAVNIETSYAPFELDFQNFPEISDVPMEWENTSFIDGPEADPLKSFYAFHPNFQTTTAFDTLLQGDTITLFSFSIDPFECVELLRPFDTELDPPSNQMDNGSDFSNGYLIGGTDQLFNTYHPTKDPSNPKVELEINCNEEITLIPIPIDSLICNAQLPYTYEWSGPNGFYSTEESPVIPNSLESGEFCTTIVDNFGCDTIICKVFSLDDPVIITETICGLGPYTLNFLTGGEGVWLFDPESNTLGASISPTSNGAAVVTFTNNASGVYNFLFENNGCGGNAEITVIPAFLAPDDLCINSGVQVGLSGGFPSGGVYIGHGVTNDGNGINYSFDPATAGVGVHTITYTFNNTNGCTDSASDDVEVFALPLVSFTAPADLCVDAGVQSGLTGGTPTGGVYSGPGVTNDENGTTYSFDPETAGAGVHSLCYTYTGPDYFEQLGEDIYGESPGDISGANVSISADGRIVAIGSPSNFNGEFGYVRVFEWDSNLLQWIQRGQNIEGEELDDQFGNRVSISSDGNVVAIGAWLNAGGGFDAGHVRIYDWNSGTNLWDQRGMDIDGAEPGDILGVNLSISSNGNIVAISSPRVGGSNSEDKVAVVKVYKWNNTNQTWIQLGQSIEGELISDIYGESVCLSSEGYVVAIGSPNNEISSSGRVRIFDWNSGTQFWTQRGQDINGNGNDGFDELGYSISLSSDSNTVAIGAPSFFGQSGYVQIYVWDSNQMLWMQKGQNISSDFERYGYRVSISSDGNIFSLSSLDGNSTGKVLVFQWSSLLNNWVQRGMDIIGASPDDAFGVSLDISGSGNIISVGSTDYDDGGNNVGYVRVYQTISSCTVTVCDDVEVFDLPTVSLSTAAGYCLDAPIANIALIGGSPTGGVYSGTGVTDLGDGVSYNFEPMAAGAGTHTISYTLTDDNGCSNTATSDIEVYECGVDIIDPCACLDNATIFDCNTNTGGDDGQFSELVAVTGAGGPLPIGQTWTVVGATGALDAFNVPAVGMQSAGVLMPSDGSVSLVYNNGSYEVPFVHVDDMGYTLMIEGPFGAGSPANVTLTISNICQYPDPVFDPAIPAMINAMDPVITLGAMDTNGGSEDGVTYTLDGNPTVEIDPSTLAMGTHTVTMTYDGADDGNGGVSPDGGTTAASPGCIQEVTKDFEIIVCMLEVDCSNVTDQTLACRADLPSVDFSLPMVTDSCGDVIRSALTIIPGNSGCPEDTLFITRTYFLQDQAGNMEECMQTFTVISTMDPIFTFFPGDTTVLCGASTDPSATGIATGTQECDFSMGDAVVTFSDVITPGSCPQEETITRRWTLTDACGRAVAMDQVIMVVDTIAPTMICQTATLELDENGMVTLTTADIDNGSNDNCGGDVTLSLSMEAFKCDNLGANDVWLIGEDACGNIDSCMTVVTVNDVEGPVIDCPGDIIINLDAGECRQNVHFDIPFMDNCGVLETSIEQTEGLPSGAVYDIGTTTNTFIVTDINGNTTECTFDVIVNGFADPNSSLACNSNINISLDQNCEVVVNADMILEGGNYACYDLYDIMISGVTGNVITEPGSYSVTITDPTTGNSCWGTINVESKSAPVLEDCACPEGLDAIDVSEECKFRCIDVDYVLNSDALTPNPTAISCDSVEMAFSDQLITDDCGTTRIIRTWLASNENGSSTCTQEFLFDPIEISELRLPNSPVAMSCNGNTDPESIVALFDNPLTKDNGNTSYVENNEGYEYAYPTFMVNGHAQKVDNQVCNIYTGYTDQELDACGEGCNGNKKVIRTWTLVDWCTLETQTYIQTIKAVDTEAPTLNTADITVGTDAWGCEATFDVPAPWELHDNCDSNPGYTVSGPAGVTIEGSFETGYLVSGLGKGVHTFVYTAYDCCGNEANYPFTVTAIDNTPPVVVAKQNVVVSLTSAATGEDGYAKLFAESINNGSYDGCGDVHLEIRRDGAVGQNDCGVLGNNSYNDDNHPQDGSSNPNSPNYDPDGGAYVKFCCEDISASVVDVDGDGTNDVGYHKVWLRVWDDGDMDGVYGTSGDQYNEAWAYVKVEDKLPPAIVCPPDVTLTCDMDYTDLDVTGRASGYASCGGLEVEWNDIVNTLNTCNDMGFIRRRWNIVGRTDIFCDQRIDMTPLAGAEPVVRFTPQLNDKEVTGCPEDIELSANERPTWVAGPCDVLGYTVEADTFLFEDGACLKIVREWTVINWCDYDPNDNPNEGIWRHTQVVKVTDDTQPTIESCDDLMFEVNDHSDSDGDGNVCEAKVTLTNIANDPGSANCPTGWLKWQVFVDLWGDGTYDYEYSSFLPTNDTNVNAPNDTNGNGIIDFYVMPTESGGTVSINLADIEGSMSNHKVDWKVTDGCNNVMTCSQNFMVVDKKAPTPYCIDISSAVMESSGTVELWAIDFNVGSFDNCTAQEALRYTFSEVAPEEDANYDAIQRSSAMVFDCDDVENSPVEVNMYVWDEKGNADYCVVYLTLVDNSGACGDGMRVAGEVATESGVGVESVEVQLNAGLPEYPRTSMSDDNGSYVFENSPVNVDYTVTASKDIDYLNGVSTLDLVKIQRHILGLESLDSPYKLIAADINADDAIKANDLSQLRKLILGVITDLPTNESWRFVDGGQEMDMDLDLGEVDYTTEITNLQSDMMNNDLVAVKVGDVTENATVNLTSENIEIRSNKTLELEIDNKSVKSGEVVEVTFRSEDFTEVYGYQFTLELKGLEVKDVQSGAIEMREGNVGILSDRVVTVSYHNGTAKSASREEGLFTMLFTATKDGQLSEMIEMTSKVTPSEAYIGESLEIREVVISTRGEIVATTENNLYQNEPNPFKEQTTIGFVLAEAGSVTMKVTDVAGKVLKVINTEGIRGMNYMTLEAEEFGVSGVLYYTIESGEFTDTKKMILVR